MRLQVLSFVLLSFVLALSASAAIAQAPPAPTGLSSVPSTAQVGLTWNSVTGATSYNLYRSLTAGGEGHTPVVTGISANSYTDTGLTNGQTYFYKVTAVNGSGESGTSNETYTTPNFFINSGGSQVTDSSGHVYEADAQYSGGTIGSTGNTITGASTQALYQYQRVGTSFTYTLPMNNGIYGLHLDFAEIEYSGPGQGVFDVVANGVTVLTNEDVYADAGGEYIAVNHVVPVTVTNGTLTVQFTASHGNASLAALTVQTPAGSAAQDIPAPGWAMDTIPTDGNSSEEAGPSSSMGVSLPSGVAENTPGPDIWAYNSVGPSVSYERMYRSSLAAGTSTYSAYNSPGLSLGWVDNYDLRVTPINPETWGKLTLTYPNGATEIWKPVLSGGNPTGAFTVTMSSGSTSGAPYFVTGVPSSTTGEWTSLTITYKDHSTNTFKPSSGNANFYLLTGIGNLVGHEDTISYDSSNRLLSIVNDASSPVTLLSFGYSGAELSTITDNNGRQVKYTFDPTNNNLNTVSEIDSPSNPLWTYTYHSINGSAPIYLASVATPNPAGSGSSTAKYQYFGTGALQLTTDANSNQRNYNYGNGYTVVSVVDPSTNNAVQYWSQNWAKSHYNLDRGETDAEGNTSALGYGDTANPYQPTTYTNANNQEDKFTYDQYGNVVTAEDYRGVLDKYDISYSDFPLGQVTEIEHWNAKVSPQVYLAPTDIVYYDSTNDNGNHAIDGLVYQVITPAPGTVDGTTETTPTVYTQYNYGSDTLGNVMQVLETGAYYTRTVTYDYTSVTLPDQQVYNQDEALGEPVSVQVQGYDINGYSYTTTNYYEYDQRGNCTAVIDALGNETDYTYNDADQVKTITYPLSNSINGTSQAYVTYDYGYTGGPVTSMDLTDQTGNSSFRTIDYSYDNEGNLYKIMGDTLPVTYNYDAEYRLSNIVDGDNDETKYEYDQDGNLNSISYPLANGDYDTLSYSYDADDNLIGRTDGYGVSTTYKRVDPESLVTAIQYTYPTGYTGAEIGNVTLGYDNFGRRDAMSDGTGTEGTSTNPVTYDDIGNVLTVPRSFTGGPQNQEVSYSYNLDGTRASMTIPIQIGGVQYTDNTIGYFYDGLGRMVQENFPWSPGNGTITYGYIYKPNGWLQEATGYIDFGQGFDPYVDTQYGYDSWGNLSTLVNSYLFTTLNEGRNAQPGSMITGSSFTMTYDAAGNRVGEIADIPAVPPPYSTYTGTEPPDASRTLTYTYYSTNELKEEISAANPVNGGYPYNDNYDYNYDYDAAGNITEFENNSVSPNADDQIDSLTYDGNGNELDQFLGSATFTYNYDPENRLISATADTPSPDTSWFAAGYDGDGLRAWKYNQPNDPSGDIYYLYDGDEPVEEEDYAGNEIAANGYGPAGAVTRDYPGVNSYDTDLSCMYDPQGNLMQLCSPMFYSDDPGTNLYETDVYTAFGTQIGQVVPENPGGGQTFNNPEGVFRFGGRWGYYTDDSASGYSGNTEGYTPQVFMTHRYYDPGSGRWAGRDPIGYQGGIDLYEFAGNNPVTGFDPNGTQEEGGEDASDIAEDIDEYERDTEFTEYKPETVQQAKVNAEIQRDQLEFNEKTDEELEKMEGKGAKRGPKLWPFGPHNETIQRRINEIQQEHPNWEHEGGGELPEESVKIPPGGYKGVRRPDISFRRPDDSMYREQVGKTKSNGEPVPREQKAQDDFERATGVRPPFTSYNAAK